jgi:hypothetical protein
VFASGGKEGRKIQDGNGVVLWEAAEPTDEADRGRHLGFARNEGLAGGPGSLSLSLGITRMRRKLTIIAVVLAVVYTTGYGVARWRKFVVMREYHLKGEGVVLRETGPGLDVRQDWRGRLKNRANPVVFFCFRPLCAVEDFFRGGRRSIR